MKHITLRYWVLAFSIFALSFSLHAQNCKIITITDENGDKISIEICPGEEKIRTPTSIPEAEEAIDAVLLLPLDPYEEILFVDEMDEAEELTTEARTPASLPPLYDDPWSVYYAPMQISEPESFQPLFYDDELGSVIGDTHVRDPQAIEDDFDIDEEHVWEQERHLGRYAGAKRLSGPPRREPQSIMDQMPERREDVWKHDRFLGRYTGARSLDGRRLMAVEEPVDRGPGEWKRVEHLGRTSHYEWVPKAD